MNANTVTIQTPQVTVNSTQTPEPKLPPFNRESMLQQINYWHNLGCTIVPFRHEWNPTKKKWDKSPVIATGLFEEWKRRPQTLEEFNTQHFDKYRTVGVLMGTPLTIQHPTTGETVTVYPVTIDTDKKGEGYTPELAQKQTEFHTHLPITYHGLTINNGEHRLFFNLKSPEATAKTEVGHIEYICGPWWVVMEGGTDTTD